MYAILTVSKLNLQRMISLTPAERGKRIKEARLAKKLTQSDVSGNFITRNMLSQIESGLATPSVKTLEYLAETLEIPVSVLIQSESEPYYSPPSVFSRLSEAKTFFSNGDYESAVKVLDDPVRAEIFQDEYEALLALSYLELSKRNAGNENAAKAVDYAKLSADYSERGIYANPAVKSEATELLSSLAQKLRDYYAGMVNVCE